MANIPEIFPLRGLKILHNRTPVTGIATHQAHTLLVYLAATESTHSRDHLADLRWQDRTESQVRGNLRVLLSSIKKLLSLFIEIRQVAVVIAVDRQAFLQIDVFPQRLSECQLDEATVPLGKAAIFV